MTETEQRKALKTAMDLFDKVGPEGMNAFLVSQTLGDGRVIVSGICKHCKANIHQTRTSLWINSGGLNWGLCEKHEPELA